MRSFGASKGIIIRAYIPKSLVCGFNKSSLPKMEVALFITPVKPNSTFVAPPILFFQSKSPARMLSVP
jgi:hypothetical protein